MCSNKASLSLFTPSLYSFSTASIFHNFSTNLVLLLLHLICLQTACWYLKDVLYIKISLADTQSGGWFFGWFFSLKNCEGNSLLRPRPSNGKFCRFCSFSKIPPRRSLTLFSSCYDWCLNCDLPGHNDLGARSQSLHFIPSKRNMEEQSLWKYAPHTSSPNTSSWLPSVFNSATSLSALNPSSPVLQMYRLWSIL